MQKPLRYLFFDLDGTLTDPFQGITLAYQRLLAELGCAIPSQKDLAWTIGPALRECLPQLLATTDAQQIEHGVARFRHYYVDQGLMLSDQPYAGIPLLLKELHANGFVLYVATSKPRPAARRILEHFDLLAPFKAVYGSELDGVRGDKADLLKHLFETECIAPNEAIMIGDRHFDIRAARNNGVRSIGLTYGYGGLAELRDAGADFIVDSPAEIGLLVTRLAKRSNA